jgi:transposase-like protein
VDHVTIWRWVQRYAPILNQRLGRERHPNRSWRADETYVRVAGNWVYLYRAVDSAGDTIHFMLSPNRDLVAAKHFLQLALHRTGRVRPRVINVDGHLAYATAISELAGSRRAMWSGKSGSSTRYTESLPNMLALGIRALPLKFAVCNTSEIINCERNNAPSSAYL